jgi:hypothetical protein
MFSPKKHPCSPPSEAATAASKLLRPPDGWYGHNKTTRTDGQGRGQLQPR